MPSYIVMMPLKRAASCSAFWPVAVEIFASVAFISSTRPSMRFSADFKRLSRISISRARLQFLAPRLQPFKNGALRRRHRLRVLLGKHHDAIGLRRFGGGSGRLR